MDLSPSPWPILRVRLKPPILRKLIIPVDLNGRLDQVLAWTLPEFSRTRLKHLIEQNLVTVDGLPRAPRFHVKGGEPVILDIPDAPPLDLPPERIELDILYEDDDLLAVNKPAGLTTHPKPGHKTGSLVNALLAHGVKLAQSGGPSRPGIVHRLDRDTSGVILVAKTDRAYLGLTKSFRDRVAHKVYIALVKGKPPASSWNRHDGIERHPVHRTRVRLSERGRAADTGFRLLKAWPHGGLVAAFPLTGRTHQIRIHLKASGLPLLIDPLYASKNPAIPQHVDPSKGDVPVLKRLPLHALAITVPHPTEDRRLEVVAPLAADLSEFLEALGMTDRELKRLVSDLTGAAGLTARQGGIGGRGGSGGRRTPGDLWRRGR